MPEDNDIHFYSATEKPIFCKVTEAIYVKDYILHVKFNDKVEGNVDLAPLMNKGVFKSIRGLKKFSSFTIDRGVVSWSPDVDIAPEYLYTHLS